ncbi:hypothetical protein EMUCRT_0554 [Ehrlichia cf. muris str. EmCRT]|uniref:Uncharacterized protein n=1 Tax=Ehrlichia cf. muris str. EmCRT TaxID=1359167 RepID=A0A0F3NFE6_9RICK|nr:hypothetical protein EMUCRT_0552 [Ehrlichia cf. muris str. EmCRT]KJV65609.1 hypothetical protein EMUCRT_0554 [Ehrlichia cf. muris str. EmCRT]
MVEVVIFMLPIIISLYKAILKIGHSLWLCCEVTLKSIRFQ